MPPIAASTAAVTRGFDPPAVGTRQQGHEGDRHGALTGVVDADDGGLRDARLGGHGRFDLHRADPVGGDVDHVVGAAEHPDMAVASTTAWSDVW